MEIFAYDPEELTVARTALEAEAAESIDSWRGVAIARLLAAPDEEFWSRLRKLVGDEPVCEKISALLAARGPAKTAVDHLTGLLEDAGVNRPAEIAQAIERLTTERDQATRTSLYAATSLRDEDGSLQTSLVTQLRRQLLVLGGELVATLVILVVYATSAPVGLQERPADAGVALWLYVALFGALGGGLSAFRSVSSRALRFRIPKHLLHGALTAVRPLLGAITALAAYVVLESGALAFRPTTTAAVLSVAFVAGFAERLVARAVEPLHMAPPLPASAKEPPAPPQP